MEHYNEHQGKCPKCGYEKLDYTYDWDMMEGIDDNEIVDLYECLNCGYEWLEG